MCQPKYFSLFYLLLFCYAPIASSQTLQKGADLTVEQSHAFRIDAIEYRAAKWETKALEDVEKDTPNRGGLIHIYITNVSDESNTLKYYQLNNKDESHWLLGRFIAWHRYYDQNLAPGESTVLEVNAIDKTFAEGKSLSVRLIGKNWAPAGYAKGVLNEDPVRISSIVQDESLDKLLFHVRSTGKGNIRFKSAEVLGHESTNIHWQKHTQHAIGEITLKKAFAPSELIILRVLIEENGQDRFIYSHRRAHISKFPIGVWSGRDSLLESHRKLHIDTVVRGGRSDDDFYSKKRAHYGFNTMVHNERGMDVDQMRSLGNDSGVLCWMLQDEPDWSILPSDMLLADQATKRINKSIPTMITLCRTVKFFEYASISDIPVHDHYSVGAPTSTKWPSPAGTRLEETGYYTRDLKEASEPKPIWVWTQGIADWNERPKRYCPTPNEIAAQLMFNIGRGAKGIIWFNWSEQAAKDYPDSVQAYRDWGRVMRTVRADILKSDPVHLEIKGPKDLDVAPLVTPDALFVCLTNSDYEIDDEAYPFYTQKNVEMNIELPQWIDTPVAYSVTPNGIQEHALRIQDGMATLELGDIEVCRLVVLSSDQQVLARHKAAFKQAIQDESKKY